MTPLQSRGLTMATTRADKNTSGRPSLKRRPDAEDGTLGNVCATGKNLAVAPFPCNPPLDMQALIGRLGGGRPRTAIAAAWIAGFGSHLSKPSDRGSYPGPCASREWTRAGWRQLGPGVKGDSLDHARRVFFAVPSTHVQSDGRDLRESVPQRQFRLA